MKKLLVLVMVVGLLAGALSVESSAKKKKKKKKAKPVVRVERTETAEYKAPGYVRTQSSNGNFCSEGTTACMVFPFQPTEKYLSVEVTDKSGTAPPVSVLLGDQSTTYCGKTNAPVVLTGYAEVGVYVGVEAPPPCQGVTTSGVVKVTFSNLP